ncbi:protein FAM200C-like [Microplitis mediator]|uniref:protein FAM200C-like n=1 Tax=Microplitis mediator TaxID=375433 RepID=UPI00255283E4|nr:protein FAM200C-like [Microplitis mediator]
MSASRTKVTATINNVVSVNHIQQIVEVLQTSKFSAYVDETTDNTNDKWMTLMTLYVDPDSLIIRTELKQLIHVDATDCCATKLLEEFTNSLEQNKIPLDYLIRLARDNAPVMVDIINSFQKHFTKRLPHLLTLSCICHSLALIARDACKAAIPGEVDEIISGIPNFVNGSPKRLAEFTVFQEGSKQNSSKLLRFAPTRWLSRQIAISRILNNWDAMFNYLTEQSLMSSVAAATKLLNVMGNPVTKAYLLFLKFALDSLENMNVHFQANET